MFPRPIKRKTSKNLITLTDFSLIQISHQRQAKWRSTERPSVSGRVRTRVVVIATYLVEERSKLQHVNSFTSPFWPNGISKSKKSRKLGTKRYKASDKSIDGYGIDGVGGKLPKYTAFDDQISIKWPHLGHMLSGAIFSIIVHWSHFAISGLAVALITSQPFKVLSFNPKAVVLYCPPARPGSRSTGAGV